MSGYEYIVESLWPLAVPIDTLTLDPTNSRDHDERNLSSIVASLETFKQRKPVVVQKDGMVVKAGNGTVMAAERLEWTHVAAVVVDEDDVDAAAYAIADNRTAELAAWNWPQLSEQLQELREAGFDLDTQGWDFENLLEGDWEPHDEDPDGLEGGDALHTVRLNTHQWSLFEKAFESLDVETHAEAIVSLSHAWLNR